MAQAKVSRALIAGFLSSLEAIVDPFAKSLQKPRQRSLTSYAQG